MTTATIIDAVREVALVLDSILSGNVLPPAPPKETAKK